MVAKNDKIFFSAKYRNLPQGVLSGLSAILTRIFAQSLDNCRNTILKLVMILSFQIPDLPTPISFDANSNRVMCIQNQWVFGLCPSPGTLNN
jgi:hypothetical protein